MSNQPPESSASRATLFLSYAHADEAKARRIATALSQAGYTVWWDALIEGGAAYAKSIDAALDKADAVIVLWSAKSVDSDWVRDEAGQGRDRHRLIPLSLDGTSPPLGFRQYQTINFSHWRGRADSSEFVSLERAIATALGQQPTGAARRKVAISRRTALVGGGVAAAGALYGATYLIIDRDWLGGDDKPPSIAVLPFKDLSGDPGQAYFSEGLTEEVRAALVRLDAFQVLAAASTEKAGEDNGDALSIARKLGVGFLLGGSVRKSGAVLRISTELTDGKTGFNLWSRTVDRRLSDIFAVQAEIARIVAQALSIQIATDRPAPGGTSNVDAYEHYLKGRSLYHLARDQATDRQALAHYDMAISADPNFAMAHAARSRVLASIAATYARADELKPLYDQSIAAARRAVELAPKLAEGHLALGYALLAGQLDVTGARPSYETAYQLGRGNADIVLLYALYCSRAGRAADARQAIDQALLLDPLNARVHRAAGSIDYAARRYAEALLRLRRAIELNPKISNAHGLMAYCHFALGRLQEARGAAEAEPTPFYRLSGLAIIDHKLGNQPAAEQAFTRLVAELGDAALYQQAQVMAQWGRVDVGVANLWKARSVGDSGLVYMATDPLLDPLRKHPDFTRLLKELKLG